MKAAVLKFIQKLVGVEFRQNADFFSTQLSKVHEYYFKGRALHRKLHFKTNNEVDDNRNYSGKKIWKKGVPEGAVSYADEIVQKNVFQQKEGSCVKNGVQHEPAIIPWDWLFTTPHTPWSLMMIMIVIMIIKIGPKINKENWSLAKMGPKNDKFMK